MKSTTNELLGILAHGITTIKSSVSASPVSNCILFSGKKATVFSAGTVVNATLPEEVAEPFLIDAVKLGEILTVSKNEEAELVPSDGKIVVKIGSKKKFTLATLPVADFPENNRLETMTMYECVGLGNAVQRVLYAAADNDHRRVLIGVNVHASGTDWFITATDGKKLARVRIDGPAAEFKITIPLDIAKMMVGVDGVSIGDGCLRFEAGPSVVWCQLLEGKFPDCNAVIPKDFKWKLELDRSKMLSAAKSCMVTADGKNLAVVVNIADGVARFESMSADVGKCSAELECVAEPIEFAINGKLLIELLSKFKTDVVAFDVAGPKSPIVVKDGDWMALVMPVKLADIRTVEVAV